MLTQMHSAVKSALWKQPVEKSVENVEKYAFSTAIWPVCNGLRPEYPGAYRRVYRAFLQVTGALCSRHTRYKISKNRAKSWNLCDNPTGIRG